jgi:signal transduction histidine kinase/ligand-binding sensor domain-containing protein
LRYVALDAWTSENGLPNNSILELRQTRDGYLWFSTFNGVGRFDGKNFTILRRSNMPLFQSNIITTFWEDRKSNLWFGVQTGGVVCLRKDGTTLRLDSTFGFTDTMIRGWTENRLPSSPDYGSIYFTANKGVYVITPDSSGTTFTIRRDDIYNLDTPEISQEILLDKRGGFWQGTRAGLYYRPSRSNPRDLRVFTVSSGLPNQVVQCLFEDRSGTIWIGTRKGVCRYEQGKIIQDSALKNLTSAHDFMEDRNGNLWIGADNGVLLWTKSSPNPQLYRYSTEDGLSDNFVRSLVEDNEGNVWIGTYYGGLNRLKHGMFSRVEPNMGLVNPIVYATLQTRDGALWVATFNGVQRITPEKTTTYTTQNGLVSSLARSLAEDSLGNVWIGSYGGLHKISPQGRIAIYTMRDGLIDDQIRSLCVARDGTLWIGTVNGVSKFKDGVFTSMTVQNGALAANSVLGITQARDGAIWISSNGGGAFSLNPADGSRATHLKPGIDLPSGDAYRITQSPTGDEIWIPCNGGLVLWRNGVATTFTREDGLPDDNTFHALEDASGALWITCDAGVARIAKKDLLRCAADRTPFTARLYTRSDGLPTNNCTVPSFATTTREGELWIPTLKGVAIINPNAYTPNPLPPAVYCQSAVTEKETLSLAGANPTIVLPAGTEQLEIRYTAICLTDAERVEFRFMLEGLDKTWTHAGNRRSAYFSHLSPGTYTFRVIACNNDGVWNATGSAATIIVEAYFYQTRWFYLLSAVAFLALGAAILRARTWRLKARAVVLEKMVHERTKQIEEHSEEIERQNTEIKRQLQILDAQAREIELANTALNEKNLHLTEANDEIQRQQHILEEQAADIELANSELQERNAQLQTLNQEKNEFLGIATHDLKNPIASIRMSVSLVQKYFDKMSKDEVLERLRAVETSAERMTDIISNLLDINAIETGNFNVHVAETELVALARRITSEYEERAAAKDLTLHFSASNSEILGYADPNIAMEIFDNLISNAVKYSPQGRNIYVRLQRQAENILIAVQDEGPGLSEDDKAKLFGKFTRLSARPTAGEHSTGLGLSIVKRMVEAMNGKVWCESELGKGATFIVELPRSA